MVCNFKYLITAKLTSLLKKSRQADTSWIAFELQNFEIKNVNPCFSFILSN